MELIEDGPSNSQLFTVEGSSLIQGQNRYSIPVLIRPNNVKSITPNEIEDFFTNTNFEAYELVVLGIGEGIQPEYWSLFQRSCFMSNCGFEWLPFSPSITLINMLIEEKRKFAAILSQNPL